MGAEKAERRAQPPPPSLLLMLSAGLLGNLREMAIKPAARAVNVSKTKKKSFPEIIVGCRSGKSQNKNPS